MNTKKSTQVHSFTRFDSTHLSESLKKLSEVITNAFDNDAMQTLQKQMAELGNVSQSFQEELQKGKLHKEIRRMGRALKKCTENMPTTTQVYTDTIATRLETFLHVVQEVEDYPIEKISVSLEQMLQTQNIESFSVKSFLKKFKKALVQLMIHHYKNHEEAAFDLLLEHELKTLKVDYLIENKALQYLEPHKYKHYLNCLNRGFNALYQDLKSYTDFSHPFFASAEKLFQNIIAKLALAAGPDTTVLISPIIPKIESQTITYPSFIFRNSEDFQLFDTLMQNNPSAEEIGFVYRKMSEAENPPTIVVKETVFRNWFNQESKYTYELKNPIKTLSRIKNQSGKEKLYILQKQLLKATSIN
jgi:hypothetical protein